MKGSIMKQNVKCPYLQNGVCYHLHCIYKPDLECYKHGMIKLSNNKKKRVNMLKNSDCDKDNYIKQCKEYINSINKKYKLNVRIKERK